MADEQMTRILRSILAALVSIGLVLSPIAVANAMGSMQMAVADNAARTAPSTSSADKPCPCCDIAEKCFAANCTTSCMQLAPASDLNFLPALAGHAALSGIVPVMFRGLALRPPTPPPRV